MENRGSFTALPRECVAGYEQAHTEDGHPVPAMISECIEHGTVPEAALLWEAIGALEGCRFRTVQGLEFTYTVKGGELFIDRKEKSITRASVELAYRRLLAMGALPVAVNGPKKLGVFGASYLYPVFIRLGLIERVVTSHGVGGWRQS